MTVSGIDIKTVSPAAQSRSSHREEGSGFGQFLEQESVQNSPSDIKTNNAPEEKQSGDDAGLSEGVTMYTAPDGTVWTQYDIGKILTDHDKLVLGWPVSPDQTERAVMAGMVAMDRADGTLTGAISTDYILGSKAKGIIGLIERWPAGVVSGANLSEVLSQL
ncbi:hypothetical protein [Agrobacterium rosae]|uniref:hypothetical protein n=1 Tax=Agrobacterium rosae TaxID=1972867 RepID=UPI003B9FA079